MPDSKNGRNHSSIRDVLRARPRRGRVKLAAIDPSETSGVKRHQADERTLNDEEHIMALQECLHAEAKRSVLIVLQGMDTCGKDGTIRYALRGLNPQGVRIVSFKAPTPNERRHDFLWRIRRQLPKPGEIAIFNRSHYEDVLIAKVRELASPKVIERRYGLINRFEADLVCTSRLRSSDHGSSPAWGNPRNTGSSAGTTSASGSTGVTTSTRTRQPSGVVQLRRLRGTSFRPTASGTGTGPFPSFSSRRWRK